MERIPLVGDLVLWRFPELKEMVVKQLSRAGAITVIAEAPSHLDLIIRLPENKPLQVFPDFDIYQKENFGKSCDGILVDPGNWKVVNSRLPDIYFSEEPKSGILNVPLSISLRKILHRDEPHHVGKEFYSSQFCGFAISLMRGIYFLEPRKQ